MSAGATLARPQPVTGVVALRRATAFDASRVLRWNNAADVRAQSRDPRPIGIEAHARWYASRLRDPHGGLWIATLDELPVGVVRIDRGAGAARDVERPRRQTSSRARRASLDGRPRRPSLDGRPRRPSLADQGPGVISIVLEPSARGRGLGRQIIALACAADGGLIVAEILPDNHASRAAFEAAGFTRDFSPAPPGLAELRPVIRYLWRPDVSTSSQAIATVADADTQQLALWQSPFGQSYTDRNDLERPERVAAWRRILDGLSVRRAVEVGCNVGWNLRYLAAAGVPAVWGVEPQAYAIERGRRADPSLTIVPGSAFALPFRDRSFDLSFTSGVLIHISPDDLGRALDELYRVTDRYLIAIEYDHPAEVEVPYRGHDGALWKRDHGAAIATRFPGLRKLATGLLGAADGYDDCTYHVFERTDRP